VTSYASTWTAGRGTALTRKGLSGISLALTFGECQQLVKPQHFQWLTAAVELHPWLWIISALRGMDPPVGLLAVVLTAANALILNSLFTFSACNG
jgi:hypothetical protein